MFRYILVLKRIIISIFEIIKSIPLWLKLYNKDFIFFSHIDNMGETLDGKIYSKLLDPIFEQLVSKGFSCLHITRDSSLYGKKIYHNSLSYETLRQFYLNWWGLKTTFLKLINLFLPAWNKYKIPNDFDSDFFNVLIAVSSVKAILCISAFKKLCEQASIRGVITIEVLHGLGYSPLPSEFDEDSPKQQLPDIILSFDDVSTKTFSKLAERKKSKVIQIENYWYNRFKSNNVPAEWINPIEKKHYKKAVLYSLQWGFDGDHIPSNGILDNGIIPNSILELIRSTEDEVLWLLRLHPVQLRSSRYESHRLFIEELSKKNSNTEYHQSTTLPLPSILSFADVHVSMLSTTAYDAAYFGLKSLLLSPTLNTVHSSMFLDILSNGYAKKIDYEDTGGILKFINETNRIEPMVNNNEQLTLIELFKKLTLL